MTRLLRNREIKSLIDLDDVLDPMAAAFGAYASGEVQDFPRHRLYTTVDDRTFRLNNMMGIVPDAGVAAVRIDADRFRRSDTRKTFLGDYTGLVWLFDIESGELVGILHDSYLSALRVAATVAIGARYLARSDSTELALLGTGKQAVTQIEAFETVCSVDRIAVFSPTVANRERFAAYFDDRLEASVRAVDSAQSAVEGADIVAAATNARQPVIETSWVTPGTHVSTTANGDRSDFRDELEPELYRRTDRIVCQDVDTVTDQQQGHLAALIDAGELDAADLEELGELVNGTKRGRTSADEITVMKPNCGMGLQFAVPGAIALERARTEGIGERIPTDWFSTDRETGGWIPAELVH